MLENNRDAMFRLSRTVIPMYNYSSLRQKLRDSLYTAGRVFHSIGKQIRAAQQRALPNPYHDWEKSKKKERVQVFLQMDAASFRAHQTLLGEFEVDFEAPADVLRTYMYRRFRQTLNLSVGQSFRFKLNKQKDGDTGTPDVLVNMLPRDDEPQTYSKVVIEFVTDSKTLEGINTIILVKDTGLPYVEIIRSESEKDDDDDDIIGDALKDVKDVMQATENRLREELEEFEDNEELDMDIDDQIKMDRMDRKKFDFFKSNEVIDSVVSYIVFRFDVD